MGAIGLNPIRLDAIGLDPIRFNAIKLGVPGASSATDRPYISPDVLSALAGVWIADGKSNTDPDRNIIKNKLPGRGGDFEILNAAYKLNSGFGKYAEDFSTMKDYGNKGIVRTSSKIYLDESFDYDKGFWLGYTNSPSPTYKVRVSGIPKDGVLNYTGGSWINLINGINELPARTNTEEIHGFVAQTPNVDWSKLVIEQIPENEGSFVTDGVNDMIVSQNTVEEMGITDKFTVVSMIHQITLRGATAAALTNYIRQPIGYEYVRNHVANIGKTGIYGYAVYDVNHSNANNSHVINTILGDKNDYSIHIIGNLSQGKFSVQGYINGDNNIVELSQVAWYWTFIAKRALTTDEINQVIAYYNLDKYVKPDIYYDVKKQGLTNDTPDEDWYLKDFSGNGRDMTLYNYARTPESGINEEGGLQSDGVDDYGQFVGDLGLKDYTVAADRAYVQLLAYQVPLISEINSNGITPFIFEYVDSNKVNPFSFGDSSKTNDIVLNRKVSYQSTYVYNGLNIKKGTAADTGRGITIGRYGEDRQYANIVLWSFLLFPYTLSEFLLERQLKKHKLGTLYPGMVEFRPIISGRTDLIKEIKWYSDSWSKRIYVGDYIPRGVDVTANILLNDNTSELVKATYGNNYTEVRKQANWSETNNEWDLIIHNIGKSPQKISITIDMYIRFEDIVQPYPVKFRFTDVDSGQVYDWGSKIKIGSTIKILSNVDIGNYLSDIYTITGYKYNGNIYSYNELKELTFLITNQPLEFASRKTYKLGGSEPIVILYPERLKLSNDTYKRLGYIPDLTGNGNHGVFNNLAFTEESGVNEDGSVHLDGVDDYISIPTLSKGGKQVLMKVNWQKQDTMLYNQNPGQDNFAIFTNDYNNNNLVVAYASRNNGNTYIDGVVNNNILATQLKGITHNIVATNNNIDATITPIIGSNKNHDNFFAQMALYAFMLFDEISTDEGIKDLNDIVGIVSKVELPPYYWDTYGKTNTDADRDEIVNLASDEVSIQYPTDFTDTSVWEDMGAVTSSTILTLTTWAMGGDTGIGNTIKAKVATPAMKVKFITDGNGYLDYMYSGYNTLELPRDAGEYEVELPASTIVDGWGARFSGSGNGSFTIELLGNEVRLGTLKVINSAYDEDSGYGGAGLIVKFSKDYHDNGFWKFVENRSEFNVLNNGDSVNIINAKSVEALFYMAATTKKAFYKVTGVSIGKGIKFGTDNVSPWEGVIAEKDGIYEVDWSLNVHTGTGDLLAPCILSNGWLGDCNIVIEQVKQYPNGIALDGVDDSLVNTDIPTFTDFTVIAKRIFLGDQPNNVVFLFKGDKVYAQGVGNALLMEYRYDNGTYANYIFSNANSITLNEGDISYVTPTDYNGQQMNYVVNTDNKGLVIGRSNAVYWKGVFYKLMLYPKTIDILSINMLKNLFERDEIIDLNNPIFKK